MTFDDLLRAVGNESIILGKLPTEPESVEAMTES
jgi:hypothetical protein